MGTRYVGTDEEVNALNTFIKLVRAAESVSVRINSSLPKKGLTESQFGVLEALYHLGPLCQRDLGSKLLKTGGNITLVVDNLEKQHLIRREREEDDRRFIKVNLTEEGKSVVEKVFPIHMKRIVEEMNVLSDNEQYLFQKLCKKLGLKKNEEKEAS